MRKVKKDAEALKAGAGDVVLATTRTKSAPSTPRKTPKKSALESKSLPCPYIRPNC